MEKSSNLRSRLFLEGKSTKILKILKFVGNMKEVQERALIQAWSETKFKSLKANQNFCKHPEKYMWQKMSLPGFCKKLNLGLHKNRKLALRN